MNPLLAINLGLAPAPLRPTFPDGVVRRCTDPDKYRRERPADFYDPDARRAAITDFVRANGPVSATEVCEWADCAMSTTKVDMQTLSRRGLIVHVGWGGRRGRVKLWSVPDAPAC